MTLHVGGQVALGEFRLGVQLTARPGEVVALLGPNGAGKSTLLRVVAGLLRLDAGKVALAGETLDDPAAGIFVDARHRRIGVVFQDHRLFPHLRVVDNVAFGLRARGAARTPSRTQAAHWLRRLHIDDLAERRPRELSGGQAQRVALARALASDPVALLLDEPLAALDVQTRAEVQGELREHLGSFAGPTVLVTHDPIEALLLADRIVVLEDGRIVQDGSAAEITSRPLTSYVAKLVGVNLYAGFAAGHHVALDGGGSLAIADPASGRVLVAVRPSSITVHAAQPFTSSARNVWSGRIVSLAPLGDRVRVTVQSSQTGTVDVTPAAVADLDLVPGREVWLSAKASDISAYPQPTRPVDTAAHADDAASDRSEAG